MSWRGLVCEQVCGGGEGCTAGRGKWSVVLGVKGLAWESERVLRGRERVGEGLEDIQREVLIHDGSIVIGLLLHPAELMGRWIVKVTCGVWFATVTQTS